MRLDDEQVRERVAAVEEMLALVEELPEGPRETALDTVQVLVELYGEALARLLHGSGRIRGGNGHAAAAGSSGDGAGPGGDLLALAREDELLSHLMVLHGLHPADAAARVEEALEEVRPLLASHGGNVALAGVEDGVARVRLEGSCGGCQSSAATVRQTVEQAILARAPEIERVETEEGGAGASAREAVVPLDSLRRRSR